jgi:hypothetical protein
LFQLKIHLKEKHISVFFSWELRDSGSHFQAKNSGITAYGLFPTFSNISGIPETAHFWPGSVTLCVAWLPVVCVAWLLLFVLLVACCLVAVVCVAWLVACCLCCLVAVVCVAWLLLFVLLGCSCLCCLVAILSSNSSHNFFRNVG